MENVSVCSMVHVRRSAKWEFRHLNSEHLSICSGDLSVIFWSEQVFLEFCSKVEEFKTRVLHPEMFVEKKNSRGYQPYPEDPMAKDSRESFVEDDDVPF